MQVIISKKFSTVETLLLLLRYREIMFNVIEAADRHNGNAIPETEFVKFVVKYQHGVSKEIATQIGLVFDFDNLLQAKVLNDRKAAGGCTKLWFNTSVIDIFRLCKISLYRPLTRVSLNASMTPIWSIATQISAFQLSITPGTDEYNDWTDEVNHRVTELLGKIRANISKLERIGEKFENRVQNKHQEEYIEISKEKYHQASRLYKREIEPLTVFLDKDTRYERGDGIFLTLEKFMQLFGTFGDVESQSLMLRYQLQYLDLFEPVKKVADSVSVYLQKTKTSIIEHNAVEKAFSIIRKAYDKTLGSDQRNKYINHHDLVSLGAIHLISPMGRLSPFRIEKNPAFLNNVFNELASRSTNVNREGNENLIFEENISRDKAKQLRHSMRLTRWIDDFIWPLNKDYIAIAYEALRENLADFSIPDLIEIGSKIHTSERYQVSLSNEFETIENETHKLFYRVRYLVPKKKTEAVKYGI
jgi:hypothetical protein